MKEMVKRERICPICGGAYKTAPAMSRIDGRDICPDCGTRQALSSMGIAEDEQEDILKIIHSYTEE